MKIVTEYALFIAALAFGFGIILGSLNNKRIITDSELTILEFARFRSGYTQYVLEDSSKQLYLLETASKFEVGDKLKLCK